MSHCLEQEYMGKQVKESRKIYGGNGLETSYLVNRGRDGYM